MPEATAVRATARVMVLMCVRSVTAARQAVSAAAVLLTAETREAHRDITARAAPALHVHATRHHRITATQVTAAVPAVHAATVQAIAAAQVHAAAQASAEVHVAVLQVAHAPEVHAQVAAEADDENGYIFCNHQLKNDYYEKDIMQLAPFTPFGSGCTDII